MLAACGQKEEAAAPAAAAPAPVAAAPAKTSTMDAIKARDSIACGVNTGLAGFSAADSKGEWSGLDV
ncbi:MAG: amino acid ABC transporter substrate-binding protein, partial [Burkholderiaceae bacterium]|nr:amino acid ABC transporter substrate-binding protein [Burkholderiaceae bacterium]